MLGGLEREAARTTGAIPGASGTRVSLRLVALLLGAVVAVFAGVYLTITVPIRERAAAAREKLQKSYQVDSLEDLLKLAPDEIDIATAALLIEGEGEQSFDLAEYRRQVDELADAALASMPRRLAPQRAITMLNRYLFTTAGFRASYNDGEPTRSFLSTALDSKRGQCLSLTTLYIAVGQRLGLPLHIVNVPEHVFARYVDGSKRINVETTEHGRTNGDAAIRGRYRITPERPYLTDGTPRQHISLLLGNRGMLHKGRKRLSQAQRDLDRALAIDPESLHVRVWRTQVHIAVGRREDALVDVNHVIQRDPQHAGAYALRGSLHYSLGKRELARRDLAKALDLEPDNPLALATRCALRFESGDYKGVAENAAKIEQSIRNNAVYAWQWNAVLASQVARQVAQQVALQEAIAQQMVSLEALIRARELEADERYQEAIEEYDDLLILSPNDATVLYRRGACWEALADHDRALADFDRVIELDEDNAMAYVRRAAVRAKREEFEAALDDLCTALNLELEQQIAETARDLVSKLMRQAYGRTGDCAAFQELRKAPQQENAAQP